MSRRNQRLFSLTGFALTLSTLSGLAFAQSSDLQDCRSPNPLDWPAPSKPYFMIAFDTSTSMGDAVSGAGSSCNFTTFGGNNNRLAHGRCAIRNTLSTFAGEAYFGLASYARDMNDCNSSCTTCTFANFAGNSAGNEAGGLGACDSGPGCGPEPSTGCIGAPDSGNSGCRQGANILVPLQQDNFWSGSPSTDNIDDLLDWVDDSCSGNEELFAPGTGYASCTPLNGILRDMYRYLSDEWTQTGAPTYQTPLASLATGERPCRSVNVILVTDGQETCDGSTAAADAAGDLFDGWTAGGIDWSIRTHVIDFGNAGSQADAIAAAGGTTEAIPATNEVELSQALAEIIGDALQPEVCNNADDNCNGCIDEGYQVFCNRGKTAYTVSQLGQAANQNTGSCCGGSSSRSACLAQFDSTGDPWFLPCWDPSSASSDDDYTENWLCDNPRETCDDEDNNCETDIFDEDETGGDNFVDEGFNKCNWDGAGGDDCPIDEICDGFDNDCDTVVDNADGSTVPFSVTAMCSECIPSTEICDGCDNDCDGEIDEDLTSVTIACGQSSPAQCAGTQTCQQAPGSFDEGSCQMGGPTFSACDNDPDPETCNGIDDDCDGVIDNNVTDDGGDCAPSGFTVGQLSNGICSPGILECQAGELVCTGFTLPQTETCDTLDNDCDNLVDSADPDLTGIGNLCGNDRGICEPGLTECVDGELVCNDPNEAVAEVCDGIDNNCNGPADDNVTDPPTERGCWPQEVGDDCATPCSYDSGVSSVSWCAPDGATCIDLGTLDPDSSCRPGRLVCGGAAGWVCQGGSLPRAEVCDGEDNDCDGEIDEGIDEGGECGENRGECEAGVLRCIDGELVCDGETPPGEEICDGLDNNCNGIVDDGLGVGGTCDPDIDTELYPNAQPDVGECQPGTIVCTSDGDEECDGAVGPSPEICDGLDNDCDGQIDESGPGPDGVNGTEDPANDSRVIGQSCGRDEGECRQGQLDCVDGQVQCVGGVTPRPEICDCVDNDCDGEVDEEATNDEQPLCANAGDECVVASAGACQCLEPCTVGEFPCPNVLECGSREVSGSNGEDNASVCIEETTCDDCPSQLVRGSQGTIECGPAGTKRPSGTRPVPVCECQGELGCHSPCFGVNCPEGERCVEVGPFVEECRPDNNCFLFGCAAGTVCSNNLCVPNPCNPNPCEDDEVCKPAANFMEASCVGSCAGVECDDGEICQGGECVETGCNQTCDTGSVCRPDDGGELTCQDSLCEEGEASCNNGAYCNPATGACGTHPCSGVVCPGEQVCIVGECYEPEEAPSTATEDASTDNAAGSSGTGDAGVTGGEGGGSGMEPDGNEGGGSSAEPDDNTDAVYGLVSGGGGCSCRTAGSTPTPTGLLGLGLGLLGMLVWRRRRNPPTPTPTLTPTPGGTDPKGPTETARGPESGPRGSAPKPGFARLGTALIALLVSLFNTGCETEAYCFDNCPDDVQGGGSDGDGGSGNGSGNGNTTFLPDGGIAPGSGTGSGSIFDLEPDNANGNGDAGTDGCDPDSAEICDGRDNDCDGQIDDEDSDLDIDGIRACGNCATDCVRQLKNVDQSGISCEPNGRGEPGDCSFETCDENFYDVDGNPENGCEYFCSAAPEEGALDTGGAQCGVDDDCDGELDEDVDLCNDENNCGRCGKICNLANASSVCSTESDDSGECNVDNTACSIDDCDDGFVDLDGAPENGCEYVCTPDGDEVCDGKDNDCDGKIDNADPDLADQVGDECFGSGEGICADDDYAGVEKCIAGNIECCDLGSNDVENPVRDPSTGVLNGVCDADEDDDRVIVKPNDQLEICDGLDNDCDGSVDDTPSDAGDTCGTGIGICPSGVELCVDGELQCSVSYNPGMEICDGVDNDCDGVTDGIRPDDPQLCDDDGDCENGQHCLDSDNPDDDGASICADPAVDEGMDCDAPANAPCVLNGDVVNCSVAGAVPVSQPCSPGTTECVNGVSSCEGAVGPSTTTDLCGEDTNCNGTIVLPDFDSDENNCGGCGVTCPASGADANARYQCIDGDCEDLGCAVGYVKCSGDASCRACTPSLEVCDGEDNDCDCDVDEANAALLPSLQVGCGIGPVQVDSRCAAGNGTTGISMTCSGGDIVCDFPPNVCTGAACSSTSESCDGIDNDCDGVIDEDFTLAGRNDAYLGQPCFSDDEGACRGEGTYVCNGAGTNTECTAVGSDPATTETCNGEDDDCDGFIDESFDDGANGASDGVYVSPSVVSIGGGVYMFSYEASRPDASSTVPGFGNTPDGLPLDEPIACSRNNRIPWANITPIEADEACDAMGGRLCSLSEYQTKCVDGGSSCAYHKQGTCGSYNPVQCNVHDYTGADQLRPTGSLSDCQRDNVFDLTGNLWEITTDGSDYVLMGGGYISQAGAGFTCSNTFFNVPSDFQLFDVGFRCCFDSDPR